MRTRRVLRLNAQVKWDKDLETDSNLLAYINGNMPQDLADTLLMRLRTSLAGLQNGADVLKEVNTSDSGDTPPDFGAIHFAYYVRCGARVSCYC